MTNTVNNTNTFETRAELARDIDTKQDYSTHTAHYPRASKYTYNYTPADKVLIESYATTTRKQIAEVMREPENRIVYRIQVLRKTGVLEYKNDMSETAKELRKLRKELKATRAELKQLKAVA